MADFNAKPIRIGRIPGGGQENVLALPYASGQDFLNGAVLTLVNGEATEASTDPSTSAGIALQGTDTNAGQDAANSPVVVTGIFVGVSMAVADNVTQFVSDLVNGSDAPVTPLQTDVGDTTGLRLRADGTWAADRSLGASGTIVILDIDELNNSVIWVFTSAAAEL